MDVRIVQCEATDGGVKEALAEATEGLVDWAGHSMRPIVLVGVVAGAANHETMEALLSRVTAGVRFVHVVVGGTADEAKQKLHEMLFMPNRYVSRTR